MLSDNDIREIVEIGGRALEYEDRFMIGCTRVNRHLYGDKDPPGLLRTIYERHYQFIVARALLSNYRYHVGIEKPIRVESEKQTFDFALAPKGGEDCFALGEMKNWTSDGREQFPPMARDIERLRCSGLPGFLLIATFWLPEERKRQRARLLEALDLQRVHQYEFTTLGWQSEYFEFTLLGFRV